MAAASFFSTAILQRWQRLKKNQQFVVGIIGSLFMLWFVDFIALRPLRNRLQVLNQEVEQTRQKLLNATAADHNAANVSKAFKGYESFAAPSGAPETELAGLLSDVENTVRQSGVVLLNLKPGQRGAERSISVAVDGESSPEQLMRLLDALQRSQRALKVTDLSVRVSESKTLRVAMVISKLLIK